MPPTNSLPGSPIWTMPNELLSRVLEFLELEDLQFARLVCHKFNDCSWPAFGQGLSQILFDLRNVDSVANLNCFSKHTHLAPYVKSLQFGCGFLSEYFPNPQIVFDDDFETPVGMLQPEDYLSKKTLRRLNRMRERYERQIFFEPVWELFPWRIGVAFEDGQEAYKDLIIESLSSILSRFRNLRKVAYSEDHTPAYFYEIVSEIQMEATAVQHFEYRGNADEYCADITGVDILLRALATAAPNLKELSIPVPRLSLHAMGFFTPLPFLHDVFNRIEILEAKLAPIYSHGIFGLDCTPRHDFDFLQSNIPKLEYLVMANCNLEYTRKDELAPERLFQSFPPTSHLTLEMITKKFDDEMRRFLNSISGSLKRLSIRDCQALNCTELLIFLTTSSFALEQYDVHVSTSRLRVMTNSERDIPKDLLYRVAKTVKISTPGYEALLQSRWA